MNKKLISAVMAAVTALSLSVSAFATTAADPAHCEAPLKTGLQIPVIKITWPTATGVVFNPYKMKLTANADGTGKVTTSGGDTSTVVSPDLVFTNSGESEIAIKVTGSVVATTTFDANGQPQFEEDGTTPKVTTSKKITIATAPIKQPSYDKTGKLVAGDTKNSVFVYLEVGTPDATGKTFTYADAYDKTNANQMILTTKDTSKVLTQISNTTGKNIAHMKVCGDISTAPTIGWDQVSKTDEVNVKLVFDASPVAPLPEKPTETPAP